MNENFPRGQRPLARVLEVFTSDDGLVRSAGVKTSWNVTTNAKRQKGEEVKTTTVLITANLETVSTRIDKFLKSRIVTVEFEEASVQCLVDCG